MIWSVYTKNMTRRCCDEQELNRNIYNTLNTIKTMVINVLNSRVVALHAQFSHCSLFLAEFVRARHKRYMMLFLCNLQTLNSHIPELTSWMPVSPQYHDKILVPKFKIDVCWPRRASWTTAARNQRRTCTVVPLSCVCSVRATALFMASPLEIDNSLIGRLDCLLNTKVM